VRVNTNATHYDHVANENDAHIGVWCLESNWLISFDVVRRALEPCHAQ